MAFPAHGAIEPRFGDGEVMRKREEPMGIVVPIRPLQCVGKLECTGKYANGHAVSLHLTELLYRRLRKHVLDTEDATGRRTTHQAVLEAALVAFLGRDGGSAT
jgi:hypothetical protein